MKPDRAAIDEPSTRAPSFPPSVAMLFDRPAHGGLHERTAHLGRACDDERRVVDLALWIDATGRVTRARFKATACVSLIACAERACQLLEAGCPPDALDAARLRGEVRGLHPLHDGRVTLVIQALRRALET